MQRHSRISRAEGCRPKTFAQSHRRSKATPRNACTVTCGSGRVSRQGPQPDYRRRADCSRSGAGTDLLLQPGD